MLDNYTLYNIWDFIHVEVLTIFYPKANGWSGTHRQHPAISGSNLLSATENVCIKLDKHGGEQR